MTRPCRRIIWLWRQPVSKRINLIISLPLTPDRRTHSCATYSCSLALTGCFRWRSPDVFAGAHRMFSLALTGCFRWRSPDVFAGAHRMFSLALTGCFRWRSPDVFAGAHRMFSLALTGCFRWRSPMFSLALTGCFRWRSPDVFAGAHRMFSLALTGCFRWRSPDVFAGAHRMFSLALTGCFRWRSPDVFAGAHRMFSLALTGCFRWRSPDVFAGAHRMFSLALTRTLSGPPKKKYWVMPSAQEYFRPGGLVKEVRGCSRPLFIDHYDHLSGTRDELLVASQPRHRRCLGHPRGGRQGVKSLLYSVESWSGRDLTSFCEDGAHAALTYSRPR